MKLVQKVLFLFLIICALSTIVPVQAMTPLNVAVLPPINTANYKYMEDVQVIQDKIKEPFKYPYYSLISSESAATATRLILADHKSIRLSDEQVMADLAKKLSADIVVVVELSQVNLREFSDFWQEETFVESGIVLKCYAYSSVDRKYHVLKVTRFETELCSVNTNAAVFFKELTEQILVKLPYKRIPTKEWQEKIDSLSVK